MTLSMSERVRILARAILEAQRSGRIYPDTCLILESISNGDD